MLLLTFGTLAGIFGGLLSASSTPGFARPTPVLARVKPDVTTPSRHFDPALTPCLAGVSPQNFTSKTTVSPVKIPSFSTQFSKKTAAAESLILTGLQQNTGLIDVFGQYQAFSGHSVVEDMDESYTVLKLSGTDSLTFVREMDFSNISGYVSSLSRLNSELSEQNIPLLYIQAPQKLRSGDESRLLPPGPSDNRNQAASLLLQGLQGSGVDTLDLREVLEEAGGNWYDWFYRTDHHWKPEAAFLSFQAIAARLEGYYQTSTSSYGTKRFPIKIDEKYLDFSNYSTSTLKNFFLGSQGKRVGTGYAGAEDFTLITPNFPTLMHYSYSGNDRYGSAEETVLFPERVEEKDYYNGNPYTYYAGGDYAFARVTNYYNTKGPKVLLLRDSFSCPLLPFLSYACSEVATIDLRYFDESQLMTYIRWVDPDVVLVMYTASTLSTPELYRFYPETVQNKTDSLLTEDKLLPQRVHKEDE